MTTETNPDALKHLFGTPLLKRMADAIAKAHPAFDRSLFISSAKALEALEMKPRVRLIREALKKSLPRGYPDALSILRRSARAGSLKGFDLWPYSDFIQTYGLEHARLSLDALKELTPLFTSEFAVRPFLKAHPALTLEFLEKCARDPGVDVRRWASEGTRPRLPWGERLDELVRDPSSTDAILERLRFDPELYVRKSVSNHLNDIAKDHPDRVVRTLSRWKKEAGSEHAKQTDWIIRRSLRTLIKRGHPGALKLIGVSPDARIKLLGLKLTETRLKLGERLVFEFKLRSLSDRPQKLVIDYVLHYVKSKGNTSAKVFKLKTFDLAPQAELLISKKHHVKEVTTRKHYPGTHRLEIQVNGRVLSRIDWELMR